MTIPKHPTDDYIRRLPLVSDEQARAMSDDQTKQAMYEQIVATPPDTAFETRPEANPGSALTRILTRSRHRRQASPVAAGGRSRKRTIAAAVTGFALLSSATAVATGVFTPDPADVAAILDDATAAADVHLEGWRPVLNAEAVLCVYADGNSHSTVASEFPLDQPLTEQNLRQACTTGNDMVRSGGADAPTELTMCEGHVTRETLQARMTQSPHVLVQGALDDVRHQFPVVLGWATDCATAELPARHDMPLTSLASLDRVNQIREVEVGIRAAMLDRCLTDQQALGLAEQARQALPGEWPIVEPETDVVRPCNSVQLDAELGLLFLFATH